MNELATVCANLQQANNEARSKAKTIYALCRSITPQFYKHTTEEMMAFVNSIQLMTQGIREDILSIMCKLAVERYPMDKSKDKKIFFDINYILGFYNQAWDEAKPEEYSCICEYGKIDGKFKVGYCRYEDFDWCTRTAKPNIDIWWDER